MFQFCHIIHIGTERALDPEGKKKHFLLKSEIETNAAGDGFCNFVTGIS
jgi:hypothetical protein